MDRENRNPLMLLAAGFAVGLLIGVLVPVSSFERERLGPVADDLKQRAKEAGLQAVRRGTEAIKESIEAAAAPARATT